MRQGNGEKGRTLCGRTRSEGARLELEKVLAKRKEPPARPSDRRSTASSPHRVPVGHEKSGLRGSIFEL